MPGAACPIDVPIELLIGNALWTVDEKDAVRNVTDRFLQKVAHIQRGEIAQLDLRFGPAQP